MWAPTQPSLEEGSGLGEGGLPMSHPCDGWPLSTGKMETIRSPRAGEGPGGVWLLGEEGGGSLPPR